MSLTVAVQMDPLEGINISGDSTFALMLGAQARGHKLYHYLADALTYADGRLYAGGDLLLPDDANFDTYAASVASADELRENAFWSRTETSQSAASAPGSASSVR